jgi:hypothetical protein
MQINSQIFCCTSINTSDDMAIQKTLRHLKVVTLPVQLNSANLRIRIKATCRNSMRTPTILQISLLTVRNRAYCYFSKTTTRALAVDRSDLIKSVLRFFSCLSIVSSSTPLLRFSIYLCFSLPYLMPRQSSLLSRSFNRKHSMRGLGPAPD